MRRVGGAPRHVLVNAQLLAQRSARQQRGRLTLLHLPDAGGRGVDCHGAFARTASAGVANAGTDVVQVAVSQPMVCARWTVGLGSNFYLDY